MYIEMSLHKNIIMRRELKMLNMLVVYFELDKYYKYNSTFVSKINI